MTKKQKKTLLRILLAGLLLIGAALLPAEGVWKALAFAVPWLVVGWDVLWDALRNILHGQVFDEKFLMALATVGAFAVGEYPEAAAVMLFYQIGEWFQSVAVGRSRKSIAALMDIRPEYAVVLRDGQEQEVDPEEVAVGETILIRPGERVPLDGTVLEGAGSLNTAALTGESMPVDVAPGDRVVSGSINLTGVLQVRAESAYENSTVARILELVENSAEKKARVESFITRFARWYTPCVVLGAALLAFIPPLFVGGWADWIHRALIFLVVSCPCALVVSVPLSFFGGIGGASRAGILIKGANDLETLASVDAVAFDKTGTLTRGVFQVDAVHPRELDPNALLDIAAAAESRSRHPVAESIVAAHGKHIDPSRLGAVTELAGLGLEAVVDGETFSVGNGKLMDRVGADWHECHLPGTVVHIAKGAEYLGHIVINDQLKPDAASAIASLKRLGVKKAVLLTGDRKKVAEAVAEQLGVDEVRAELLPEQKVEEVERLLASGVKLAFVGDGINDAPVLARADLGIAMGAMGSDAAIESADVVLMDDKPSRLSLAVRIARKTMGIVRQNIVLALAVKFAILILGALGYADMWLAVFGDVGVLILAILNAMRCLLPVKETA
ncbi:MAG: cadmium-translocating P-type ATPase [Oscillospiraceae bacterium]|nr:cadmium-translocating P-type ATPase [Oscillospiraceae bacterium]